jgi:hypothetical protein
MTDAADGKPIGVIFSLHPQFVNFARFLEGLRLAAEGGVSAGVSFMYDVRYPAEARRYVAELLALREKIPFFVMLNLPYTGEGAMGAGCTRADLEWLAEMQRRFDAFPPARHLRSPFFVRITCELTLARNGTREVLPPEASLALLETLNTPSYTGFHCVSGANVLFIEEDGAIRGGVCDRSQPMGNLFTDPEIVILQRMNVVCCTAPACNSIENIPLPRFRDAAEAAVCLDGFRQRAKSYFYRAEGARLRSSGNDLVR